MAPRRERSNGILQRKRVQINVFTFTNTLESQVPLPHPRVVFHPAHTNVRLRFLVISFSGVDCSKECLDSTGPLVWNLALVLNRILRQVSANGVPDELPFGRGSFDATVYVIFLS